MATLKEIVLEKDSKDFEVFEQYDKGRERVAKFCLFGEFKGSNILEVQEDWYEGGCFGVARRPINIIPLNQDLQASKYQSALDYATNLASEKSVPLIDKTKSAKH